MVSPERIMCDSEINLADVRSSFRQLSCQDGSENVEHLADSIGLVGDRSYAYPASYRNSTQTNGVARHCRNHRKSVLSILVRNP
jgi:hypothetical protein